MSDSGIFSKLFDDTDKTFARNRNVFSYTCLGSFLIFSVFILSKYPCMYLKFSSVATGCFLIIRIIHYVKKRWFLYLFDYCYIVNLIMIYLAFNSTNRISYGTLLATTFYPIINVYRYQNSLVLHNQEIFFTCYMHLNPTVALSAAYISGCIDITTDFSEYLIEALKWHTAYAAFYFPLLFIVIKPFWMKYKIPNLYSYHSQEPFYQKIWGGRPVWFGGLFVYAVQVLFILYAAFISYFVIGNHRNLVGLLCIVVIYTLYRAATYYIDYMPATAIKQSKKNS